MWFNCKNIIWVYLFGFVFDLYLNRNRTEKLLRYIDLSFGCQSVFPINTKVLDSTVNRQSGSRILVVSKAKDDRPRNTSNEIKDEPAQIVTEIKKYFSTGWCIIFYFSNKKVFGFTRFRNISPLLKHPEFVG